MEARCLVTYPCPARKPRLEGLTLSLNTTISMLWHLWSDEAGTGEHSSTTHHWSASPSDAPVICWSLIDMGLKKTRSERSECSEGRCARVMLSPQGSQTIPYSKWITQSYKMDSFGCSKYNAVVISMVNVQETVTNLLSAWLPFWTLVLWDPWWTLAAEN